MKYKEFIEARFHIVNKEGQEVPFILNKVQQAYVDKGTNKDVILKARKQGFSSYILARYTADFILRANSRSVVVADNKDNAIALLDRVKFYLNSYAKITGVEVPLKYNSKYELVNASMNSRYFVGTAENAEFGRSQDITNLHFSEAAFYGNFNRLRASALQATVSNAHVVAETTANGFGEFRQFWIDSNNGATGFNPLFFKASDFYSQEFLEEKRKELGSLFKQEYPETDMEAFLTSGDTFFDTDSLSWYLGNTREQMASEVIYA